MRAFDVGDLHTSRNEFNTHAEQVRKFGMPLLLGNLTGRLIAGPYRQKPRFVPGVKMAAEIEAPCEVSIPTQDFSTPDPEELVAGMIKTLPLLASNGSVYVGCMGGKGRTGIFIAAMAKVMLSYYGRTGNLEIDPVEYVRKAYYPHLVETLEQGAFVRELDVSEVLLAVEAYNRPAPIMKPWWVRWMNKIRG